MKSLFDLSNRIAVVTGGSKGLGLAMAGALCTAGAKVVLASRHGEEAAAAARSLGESTRGFEADVTSENDMAALMAFSVKEFGSLDILINSAGINIRGAIDKLTLEDYRRVQQVNVEGTWLASRAAVPHMKARGHGRIINMASALGTVGLADRTPYCTSKGAVVQLTRSLAIELAPHKITVNAILPGPFLTEINEPVKDDPVFKETILGATAMKRWGELPEIQGAALYFASDFSGYTTGALLAVDGGWTAR